MGPSSANQSKEKRLRIGKNFQAFFMLKIGIKKYTYICTREGVLNAFLRT
jgi:hypothetical protein